MISLRIKELEHTTTQTDKILLKIGYEMGWNKVNDDKTIISGVFRYFVAGNKRVVNRFIELSECSKLQTFES